MREVTKSVIGFTWAVSMFGVQQVSRLVARGAAQPVTRTAAELDEVARAIQGHLFGASAMQYRMGDEWQRRLVDAMFDMATLKNVDPRQLFEQLDPRAVMTNGDPRSVVETGVTVFQKSMDTVKQGMDSMRESVDDLTRKVSGAAADADTATGPTGA